MNQATQETRDLRKSIDSNRFIVALIDGDSMPFLDTYVTRGFEGGIELGRQLRQALRDYHQTNPFHRGDDKILIYITANLQGLSRAYTQAGITVEASRVRDFFVGVSQSHPLTNFIDAGSQKEAADSRLRAQMELYYSNTHCQQVIFGGSDSGYAPFLDTFANSKDVNKRITVLNPSHMPPAMGRTLSQFLTTSFPQIFREAKIVTSRSFSNIQSPAGSKRPASDLPTPPERRPPAPTYHGPVKTEDGDSSQDDADTRAYKKEYHPEDPFLVREAPSSHVYFVNQYGQRLDQPLVYDKRYLRYLFTQKTRLCNNFYLRQHCPYGDQCSWDHSEDLTPLQIDTLRHKARTSACRDPYCDDVGCVLGHQCPRPAGDCAIEACKFLPQQHDVPVDAVFEVSSITGERSQVPIPSAHNTEQPLMY